MSEQSPEMALKADGVIGEPPQLSVDPVVYDVVELSEPLGRDVTFANDED